MGQSSNRLGVDIGGTFTDVVLEIGEIQFSSKVLTTYSAPEDAIIDGMQQVCSKAGISASDINQIIHGTTLATNALIERRGAKTALITTNGFRDVIEMRTESRFEQYDLNLNLPEPLLPRQSRLTLEERVDASGAVLISPNIADVEALADQIERAGYESVAVGFLHSYVNSSHERLVRDVLLRRLPNIMISLSSQVSPQMREYERFNTVVANAYIKPLMKSYLGRLEARLHAEGVACPVFLMHSGGGIISIDSASEFPVRLVESGPAGGAVFAANIAARYDLDKVVSFDMGGTTAKICLIKNQTPRTSRVFEVARTYRFKKGSGMPISIPVIDMVEIGAGGGSLAHVDSLHQIRVGPESAGSEPGPACYGRGGARPAVTDADLVLGKLDPDNFAGGSIALDTSSAESALHNGIGDQLNMDAVTAAFGLAEVVDENMANAARVHAVENGEDLAEYTMIAFGGAAPLHAGRLCEKLGIQRLLVPPGAGVGSAIGFLRAPFSFEANRSVYMHLSDFNPRSIISLLSELQDEATSFVKSCDAESPISAEFKVFMRYSGQGWEIPIQLSVDDALKPSAETFQRLFEEEYAALFGRTVSGMDIEITVWSVNATTPAQTVKKIDAYQGSTSTSTSTSIHKTANIVTGKALSEAANTGSCNSAFVQGSRMIFDAALNRSVDSSIVHRTGMRELEMIKGPAAITEDETTIILPSSRVAIKQSDGCIDINIVPGEA